MGDPVKFVFDAVFTSRDGAPWSDIFTRDELEAARDEGWNTGAAEGAARERATAEGRLTEALETIGGRLAEIAGTQAEALERTARDATTLTLAIARKVAPELLRRQPLVEIEAMITECLEGLVDEPRVVARVPDALLDELAGRIDDLAARGGYEGRVVLLADPSLNGADCRLEWADGGAERDQAAVWRALETAIERLLGAPVDEGNDNASCAAPGDVDGATPELSDRDDVSA